MPKIIEIFRESKLDLPTRFLIGQEITPNGPIVDSISFYETGAFGGKAYRGPCFVVAFRDSNIRRIIPAPQVIDIAWENDEKVKNIKLKVPEME